MVWQDIVITIASITFSAALLPQVRQGFKEKTGQIKLSTSVPTFMGLYAITVSYLTLALYFSAVTSFLTGTMWLILAIQRMVYARIK